MTTENNFKRLDFSKLDWYSILPRFGVDPSLIANPKKLGACPIEGEGKTRFRFANNDGRGVWHCNQCGHGDGVRLVALMNGVDDKEAIKLICNLDSNSAIKGPPLRIKPLIQHQTKDVSKIRYSLERVWTQSTEVKGTGVEFYIKRRVPMFNLHWLSDSVRANPALYHYDEGTRKKGEFPAMVSRAVGLDDMPVTIHRTYLTDDGFKAPVSPDQVKKQMTGIAPLAGESVHLNTPVLQSRTLVVCEGIETGLALVTAMGNRHEVWAALNAGNLSKLQVPRDRFDSVVIAADKDPMNRHHGWRTGEHYAEILLQRLLDRGFRAKIRVPDEEGTDYADLWLKHCLKLKLVA